MKVLGGTLKETLFAWPEQSQEAASGAQPGVLSPMTVTKAMTHTQDAVTYINGGLYTPIRGLQRQCPTQVVGTNISLKVC